MTTLAPLLQEDGQPIAPDSAPVRVRVCSACWALHADTTGVASTAAAAGGPTETRAVHSSLFADRMRRNGYATLAHLATGVSLARAATFEVAQGAGVASTKAPSPSPSPSKPRASTHAHATRLDPAKSLRAPRLGTLSAQLGEPSMAPQWLPKLGTRSSWTRAMSTATEHDDWPEAKPLPAADSAQARAPLVAMLGDRDAADTKGGAALFHAPLSRYFTRTVSAGGVCDVIVLRLKRYMGHCECQLNTCSTQAPTDVRSQSHSNTHPMCHGHDHSAGCGCEMQGQKTRRSHTMLLASLVRRRHVPLHKGTCSFRMVSCHVSCARREWKIWLCSGALKGSLREGHGEQLP
jgi:hypothetical protein